MDAQLPNVLVDDLLDASKTAWRRRHQGRDGVRPQHLSRTADGVDGLTVPPPFRVGRCPFGGLCTTYSPVLTDCGIASENADFPSTGLLVVIGISVLPCPSSAATPNGSEWPLRLEVDAPQPASG